MATRKILSTGVLPILMLLFATGSAAAKHPAASPPVDQRELLLRTPEDRMQEWRDGLLTFMAKHRGLTLEQESAIQNLASFDTPTSFAHDLESAQRNLFATRLDELGRVLSYTGYLTLLRSFDDELRTWLIRNGLVSQSEASLPYCNCGSGADCISGLVCEDVACIVWSGTSRGTVYTGSCGAEEQ